MLAVNIGILRCNGNPKLIIYLISGAVTRIRLLRFSVPIPHTDTEVGTKVGTIGKEKALKP